MQKVSVEMMEEVGDITLLAAMKRLWTVVQDTDDHDMIIKASNATVNLQKYLTGRKIAEREELGIEDDLGEVMGGRKTE